ncbi:hypothetical protein DASC09_044920 [Saccharomycopsis crataegensis]|uniref:Uncharacterized protein n=1 Tax=Saccharomycopsis crataegensis TaxID=43959 RepID=A0AAV5QQL6_9ASCO|nr:hypothetical protein DASC09_044920 [Saccharomycopsis crataegensis]
MDPHHCSSKEYHDQNHYDNSLDSIVTATGMSKPSYNSTSPWEYQRDGNHQILKNGDDMPNDEITQESILDKNSDTRLSNLLKKLEVSDNLNNSFRNTNTNVLKYYKGLINDSFDSLENHRFNTIINEDSGGDTSSNDDQKSELDENPPARDSAYTITMDTGTLKIPHNNKSEPLSPKVVTPTVNKFHSSMIGDSNSSAFPNSHHKELSPLVFIDSPVRNKHQAKNLSIIEPTSPLYNDFNESIDLRSINDSNNGINFAFQYMKLENDGQINQGIENRTQQIDILNDTELNSASNRSMANYYDYHTPNQNNRRNNNKVDNREAIGDDEIEEDARSIDRVPYMKKASMSEYELAEIMKDSPSKPPSHSKAPQKSLHRKISKPSLSILSRSNTISKKDKEKNNDYFSVRSPINTANNNNSNNFASKPKLKTVKSLPQLRRLNSFSIRRKNTLTSEQIPSFTPPPLETSDDSPLNAVTYYTTPRPSISEIDYQNRQRKGSFNTSKSHSRWNSNTSSSAIEERDFSTDKSSIGDFQSDEGSITTTSNTMNSFASTIKKSLQPHRHKKSSSNVTTDYSPSHKYSNSHDGTNNHTDTITNSSDFFLPKLHTSGSSTSMIEKFGKLKTGIRKLSSPVASPKHETYLTSRVTPSIDGKFSTEITQKPMSSAVNTLLSQSSNMCLGTSKSENITPNKSKFSDSVISPRTLAKKTSFSNLYRSKSTKTPRSTNSNNSSTVPHVNSASRSSNNMSNHINNIDRNRFNDGLYYGRAKSNTITSYTTSPSTRSYSKTDEIHIENSNREAPPLSESSSRFEHDRVNKSISSGSLSQSEDITIIANSTSDHTSNTILNANFTKEIIDVDNIVNDFNISSDADIQEQVTTLKSPVIKVNALNSARFSEYHFENYLNEQDMGSSQISPPLRYGSLPYSSNHKPGDVENGKTDSRAPSDAQRAAFKNSNTEMSNDASSPADMITHLSIRNNSTSKSSKEVFKNSLIRSLTLSIQQMQAEDQAFATIEQRLIDSGWYSESNIHDIQRRRALATRTWKEKISDIKKKLEKIHQAEKRKDYNIKTPKRTQEDVLDDLDEITDLEFEEINDKCTDKHNGVLFMDPLERFVFETSAN